MCGIVGFWGLWSQAILEKMTRLIRYRGPDDIGFYFAPALDRFVGLGMCRLSIIDLHTGHQPIWNEDRTKVIIFNGEIYNYRLLRTSLKAKGHVFTTQTDTEVILHGYEEFGPEVVNRLEGMFAFAIWDDKTKQFFLARDRLGIKPLYYYQAADGSIAFSSEIKSILPLLPHKEINLKSFYHYLLYGFGMRDETLFKEIYQIPPACYMIWEGGKLTLHPYWRLEKQSFQAKSEEDWAEQIRSTLLEAVKSHLVADVPVGITLSGGVDSSSILALMTRATTDSHIHAVTVGYNRPDDEIRFSRIAASPYHIQIHERYFSIEETADHFRKIIYHLEEPIAHAAMGTTYFLSKTVREHLKVVLIGEGSDELFCGYQNNRLFMFPFYLAPRSLIRHYYLRIGTVMPSSEEIESLLQSESLDRQIFREMIHLYDPYFKKGPLEENSLRYQIEIELVAKQLLRIDKLMMAHSVEARVPFLDRAFVELAFSIPFHLKIKNRMEKYIFRKAMEPLLPHEVVYRPKMGKKGTQVLKSPLIEESLLPKFGDLLKAKRIEQRGFFKGKALEKYLSWPLSIMDRVNPVRSRMKPKFILAILAFEIWCQVFLDGKLED